MRDLFNEEMLSLVESGRMTDEDLDDLFDMIVSDDELSEYVMSEGFVGFRFVSTRKESHEIRDRFVEDVGEKMVIWRKDPLTLISEPISKTLVHGKYLGLNYALIGDVTETGEERYMMTIHPYRRGNSGGVLER